MKKYGGFIPGIRAGRPTAEYLDYVLTRVTLPGLDLPRADRAHPAHRVRAGRRQPELPVRWRVDPHHRRCRSRDGQADRLAAAAAALRGPAPLTRLLMSDHQGPARGPRRSGWQRRSASRRSRRATSSAATIENETPLGKQVKAIMDAGDNVPDSLTNDLIRHRLEEQDAEDGFLLDGYPRTLDQVRELDEFLAGHGAALDAVHRAGGRPGCRGRAPAQARASTRAAATTTSRSCGTAWTSTARDRPADRHLRRPRRARRRSTRSAPSTRSPTASPRHSPSAASPRRTSRRAERVCPEGSRGAHRQVDLQDAQLSCGTCSCPGT